LYVPVAAAFCPIKGRRSVTIQAQSFDGAIHQFPDGTDPAVIDRVVKQYTLSGQQQSQGAKSPSTFNDRTAPGNGLQRNRTRRNQLNTSRSLKIILECL
jgi:hypothetical protein